MPVATKCQIFTVNGQSCDKPTYGFVVCHEDSPLAVYKAGVVLCRAHGKALQDITPQSQLLTIGELEDLMTREDMKMHSSAHKGSPMHAVQTLVQTIPVAPVVPSASLVALAAQLNGHTVDTAPAPVVETTPETQPAPVPAPVTTEEKPAKVLTQDELDELELQKQIKALQDKLEAKKHARAEAERVKTLAVDPWSVFPTSTAVRVHVMLQGGSAALRAVEVLLKAEVLSVHQGRLIVVKNDNPAPMASTDLVSTTSATATTAAAKPTAKHGAKVKYSETMRQSVLTLKARGLTDKEIEAHLHIGEGDGKAAWSLRNRRA